MPDGTMTTALSLLPYRGTWRAASSKATFSRADILEYLTNPAGTLLQLPLDVA